MLRRAIAEHRKRAGNANVLPARWIAVCRAEMARRGVAAEG